MENGSLLPQADRGEIKQAGPRHCLFQKPLAVNPAAVKITCAPGNLAFGISLAQKKLLARRDCETGYFKHWNVC